MRTYKCEQCGGVHYSPNCPYTPEKAKRILARRSAGEFGNVNIKGYEIIIEYRNGLGFTWCFNSEFDKMNKMTSCRYWGPFANRTMAEDSARTLIENGEIPE